VVPAEATQIVGTLVVVYGLFMTATGWPLALLVWGYTLVSFFVASAVKIGTYWLLDNRTAWQSRHLMRIESRSA
jgi:H+-transporting ATPase